MKALRVGETADHEAVHDFLCIEHQELALRNPLPRVDVDRRQLLVDGCAVRRRGDHNGRVAGIQSLPDETGDSAGERLRIVVETDRVEGEGPADRRDEIVQHLPLRHQRRGADLARRPGEFRIVVSGGEDDPGRARQVPDDDRRLEPVQAGHRDVEDDEIGTKRATGLDRRLTIGDRRDHVELGCEQARDPRARLVVIVRDYDPGVGHMLSGYYAMSPGILMALLPARSTISGEDSTTWIMTVDDRGKRHRTKPNSRRCWRRSGKRD